MRRQTRGSAFSYWTISDEELISRIESNFSKAKQGYRTGVILVPVNPEGFYSSLVELKSGDLLVGEYSPRREGEEPRKSTYVFGEKTPAKCVDVVLYSHEVLLEKSENESDEPWEIVSVNASPIEQEVPIPVGTLIANHFEFSGGTATKMSDSEFVEALKISTNFWKNHANVAPDKLMREFSFTIM